MLNHTELNDWRVRLGLNRDQMARFVGMPSGTYANYERGDNRIPAIVESMVTLLQQLEVMYPDLIQNRVEQAKGEEL